jgi:hypothetical protein
MIIVFLKITTLLGIYVLGILYAAVLEKATRFRQ